MEDKLDALVIGGGIFGSVIARALIRKADLNVAVVDDAREGAGSPPAACLMKNGWFSGFGRGEVEASLGLLDELIGVKEIDFKVLSKNVVVHWCDPNQLLIKQVSFRSTVKMIQPFGSEWIVGLSDRSLIQVRLVVVATGIWTPLLLPEVRVSGLGGVAWLWENAAISDPFIRVWAPYKQLVGFNRGDGLWIGDGTAVKTWSEAHESKSLQRCSAEAFPGKHGVTGVLTHPKRLFGWRPYVKDAKPALFKQLKPGLFVATGGAKNGTIAAGWCANQLLRMI